MTSRYQNLTADGLAFELRAQAGKPHMQLDECAAAMLEKLSMPTGILEKVPDWVIEIESVGAPLYVNECIEGAPGRTCDIANAERYSTENEASENVNAIRKKYPNRRYRIRQLVESTSSKGI